LKRNKRIFIFIIYTFGSFIIIYFLLFIFLKIKLIKLILDWSFWPAFFLYLISIEEFFQWAKNGRRSEMSDLIAIGLFFFVIFFFTKDWLTSIMGSFSIYLWIGVVELKEYPVINKILIISLVTYNIIFIAGLISFYLDNPFILNTTFAFSFWIILGLGFLLFGRKYIVVWRFMSPTYLVLFLYIIAWLAVVFINRYTPLEFIYTSPLESKNINVLDFFLNIYFVLIIVNWIIYFLTGSILDKLLGIKKIENEKILEIVNEVKENIGIKDNIKIGFGKYPILNAMAYGPFFDKRIAIIAEDLNQIPSDELKGIVAHELSHAKGNHTLILTIIASFDLLIRMLLGIPATYYDYTFGNPKIPMIGFIFLNLAIYMFIYIIVRILEGKADLMSKKAGYAENLAKALYNLESFYATGREIGLNTMLLSEEKISKDNQLLDYFDTAQYLYKSMIKPSRGSLLANFLNSHPPTYHRIAAILGDNLKPSKEALLPFICLKRSKQKKYAKKFEQAREKFKKIATEKFKEFFEVDNISKLFESLERRKIYQLAIGNDFIFKNLINDELIVGKMEDVVFHDDICDLDYYIVRDFDSGNILELKAALYNKLKIALNQKYVIENKLLTLKTIKLNEDKKDGFYVFIDERNNSVIHKSINKIRLPNSIDIIEDLKNNEIFLKSQGILKIFKVKDIISADKFDDYEIEIYSEFNEENDIVRLKLKELIIRPFQIYFPISRTKNFRNFEFQLINWLIQNRIRAFIYLKKPVNNLEIGYLEKLELNNNKNNIESNQMINYIIIKNIFGKNVKIPYNSLEIISFEYKTAMIQKKSETSFASKIGYRLIRRFKPQKVIFLQKL